MIISGIKNKKKCVLIHEQFINLHANFAIHDLKNAVLVTRKKHGVIHNIY